MTDAKQELQCLRSELEGRIKQADDMASDEEASARVIGDNAAAWRSLAVKLRAAYMALLDKDAL